MTFLLTGPRRRLGGLPPVLRRGDDPLEHDLYAGRSPTGPQRRLVGAGPPPSGDRAAAQRPESSATPPRRPTSTTTAEYYDYAIATVIKFQRHDHIAREILKQDPRACNYYRQAGRRVPPGSSPGPRGTGTRSPRGHRRGLSAPAMVAYFAPRPMRLSKENRGRAGPAAVQRMHREEGPRSPGGPPRRSPRLPSTSAAGAAGAGLGGAFLTGSLRSPESSSSTSIPDARQAVDLLVEPLHALDLPGSSWRVRRTYRALPGFPRRS